MTAERGDCYEAAWKLIDGMSEVGATLVHGKPVGTGEENNGIRFGHAWVELSIAILDPSNGKLVMVLRDEYYKVGKIRAKDNRVYTREEAMLRAVETGTFGPWDD